MADIKQVVENAWGIFENKQIDRLGEVFTAATEFRMPGTVTRGPDEFRGVIEAWWGAFPDMRHQIVTSVANGDSFACELVLTGTHKGTLRLPNGDIPATGKSVRMQSCDYITVKDGKIATWHAYPDMIGMLAQITG